MSGRVATLRAPSVQRPIRKSGRCSGEFFTRKGSSRSQTPLVIPQPEFRVKYLHYSSVRMVWPTVYDGQEVTINSLFYFYPNVVSYVSAIKNSIGYVFFIVLIVFAGIQPLLYRQSYISFHVIHFSQSYVAEIQIANNKQM